MEVPVYVNAGNIAAGEELLVHVDFKGKLNNIEDVKGTLDKSEGTDTTGGKGKKGGKVASKAKGETGGSGRGKGKAEKGQEKKEGNGGEVRPWYEAGHDRVRAVRAGRRRACAPICR